MAHEYEDQWDEFLDVYQKVRTRVEALQLLISELIENIEGVEDKEQYLKAYKEVIHG